DLISTNYGLASWVPHRAALFVGGTGGEPFFTSAKNRKSRCRAITKVISKNDREQHLSFEHRIPIHTDCINAK
ncbi:MAG: hypothetical protein ACLQPD_25585, partial [Desulfomonilaceae bacterium]